MGMEESMMMRGKTARDGVGMVKLWIFLFMMLPCCTVKVWSWARQQFIRIVQANIGRRPKKVLVSSTSAAVIVLSANALSRNLHLQEGKKRYQVLYPHRYSN